jgi:acyl-CoA synthetase (AMP-forming)/AMP-acid ligase II
MYGATEASARLTYLDPACFESKIESIGKPIPNVSITLRDEEDKAVPEGKEGELVAQGTNIMQGYWKDPKDTARVLNDKGYHTGDIGYRDKDGFLYINRRKDGLLKVGGHRINPTEIEDFLMNTNQLIETSVVGLPDKLMGNNLIALIVPKNENCEPKNLMESCAKGLPKHKHPTKIIPVRTLPKNANGKIDKTKCQQLASKTQ